MYSRYLGMNDLKSLGVRQAIVNAQKASEVVKSEIQLTKMTNLLKSMNSENQMLTKKVGELHNQNKQLKKVISNREENNKNQITKNQERQIRINQYASLYSKPNVETARPVDMNYSTRNINYDDNIDNPHNFTFKPILLKQFKQYKSTQTSPPKTIPKAQTHEIAISTNRTPQKYQTTSINQNPQTFKSSKRLRTSSLHKLTPSNSIQIKNISMKSFRDRVSQQTPERSNIMQRNSQNSNKKRFLSLISLKK